MYKRAVGKITSVQRRLRDEVCRRLRTGEPIKNLAGDPWIVGSFPFIESVSVSNRIS